jgi:fatty acyl-CoA reductase
VLKAAGLPNNYTLTKHMCEDLLADLHGDSFRVAIVRPTIIGALAAAPLPGYFGNAAGVTSSILAFASGALPCLPLRCAAAV